MHNYKQNLGPMTCRVQSKRVYTKPRNSELQHCLQDIFCGRMIGDLSPGRGWEFFSSPSCTDRFWGPSSLLSIRYQGLFLWE